MKITRAVINYNCECKSLNEYIILIREKGENKHENTFVS